MDNYQNQKIFINIYKSKLLFRLYPIKYQIDVYGYKSTETHKYIGLLGMIERREVDVIPRVNFYLGTWDIMDYTFPMWKNKYKYKIDLFHKI